MVGYFQEMPCPWSGSQLKKLGLCLRDELTPPAGLPEYSEVMLWFNELAVAVANQIEQMAWSTLLPGKTLEVTSRPKTVDTLTQKLRRERHLQLPSIQDIAGVRVDVEMTLADQDRAVEAICTEFAGAVIGVRDLRSDSHSGYRAVHIWLKHGGRVEIQVRTHLQSEWANMYERAADLWGRGIRYDELPEDPTVRDAVIQLQRLSMVRVAEIENLTRSRGHPVEDGGCREVDAVAGTIRHGGGPPNRRE
jgi:ppGpp synthetase/RelA/SpoT-type nucleotidyltranferase